MKILHRLKRAILKEGMSVCSFIFTIFMNTSYLSLHSTANYKLDFPPPIQSYSQEFQLDILEVNNLSIIKQDSYSSAHLSFHAAGTKRPNCLASVARDTTEDKNLRGQICYFFSF